MLANDIDWNEAALISQFRIGLKSELKDLLINYDAPNCLEQYIALTIKCDNRLFEHQQEKRQYINPTPTWRARKPYQGSTKSQHTPNTNTLKTEQPQTTPMELSTVKKYGPLTEAE